MENTTYLEKHDVFNLLKASFLLTGNPGMAEHGVPAIADAYQKYTTSDHKNEVSYYVIKERKGNAVLTEEEMEERHAGIAGMLKKALDNLRKAYAVTIKTESNDRGKEVLKIWYKSGIGKPETGRLEDFSVLPEENAVIYNGVSPGIKLLRTNYGILPAIPVDMHDIETIHRFAVQIARLSGSTGMGYGGADKLNKVTGFEHSGRDGHEFTHSVRFERPKPGVLGKIACKNLPGWLCPYHEPGSVIVEYGQITAASGKNAPTYKINYVELDGVYVYNLPRPEMRARTLGIDR